jgi:hypothetical protein
VSDSVCVVTLSDFVMVEFEVSNEVRLGFVGRGWCVRCTAHRKGWFCRVSE